MIPHLRAQFNRNFTATQYDSLRALLEEKSHEKVPFRVAETPIFVDHALLERIAAAGAEMAHQLIANHSYLAAARQAIPPSYCVAGETAHPNFLTADFALVDEDGALSPKLVEIQAFPSVYGFQAVLGEAYQEAYTIKGSLGTFLSGLDNMGYFSLLRQAVLGDHDPENVVLTEVDPKHQKTRPDFEITSRQLGIPIVDISTIEAVGNKLHYRGLNGRLIPIERIYNRAIADELMARNIRLQFDLTREWQVEWAGHPNWYFLISKFSIPLLANAAQTRSFVPPAVFLDDFLSGTGRAELESAGVRLPAPDDPEAVYRELLLKPLFSFAGKGIQFDPERRQLLEIPPQSRREFLLQQRMSFVPTIDTPFGMTQAEIRILYLWPDKGVLTPVSSLVRLGRGKMMGVDHNRDQQWVGASAAFFPR